MSMRHSGLPRDGRAGQGQGGLPQGCRGETEAGGGLRAFRRGALTSFGSTQPQLHDACAWGWIWRSSGPRCCPATPRRGAARSLTLYACWDLRLPSRSHPAARSLHDVRCQVGSENRADFKMIAKVICGRFAGPHAVHSASACRPSHATLPGLGPSLRPSSVVLRHRCHGDCRYRPPHDACVTKLMPNRHSCRVSNQKMGGGTFRPSAGSPRPTTK